MIRSAMTATMAMFLMVGCGTTSLGKKYSISRGVADLGATAYLDAVSDFVIKRDLIETFSASTVAWLNANRESITDNEFLKTKLRELVPSQFWFFIDIIVDKFGPVPAHNIDLAINFFMGVNTGSNLYARHAGDPVFEDADPMIIQSHSSGASKSSQAMRE